MFGRFLAGGVGLFGAGLLVLGVMPPAWADPGQLIERQSWADVDGDGIPDVVEEGLCGSATCARPDADVDGDGIPDWVEFEACGSATCATPRDSDKDCVPDYVNLVLCGDGKCSAGVLHGDADGDGIQNWVEVVVAGNYWSATGADDRNGNGIPDVTEVTACVAAAGMGGVPAPAGSGGPVLGWLGVSAGLLLGGGLLVRGRRGMVAGGAR